MRLSVKQLKEELDNGGWNKTGNKTTLINRVLELCSRVSYLQSIQRAVL